MIVPFPQPHHDQKGLKHSGLAFPTSSSHGVLWRRDAHGCRQQLHHNHTTNTQSCVPFPSCFLPCCPSQPSWPFSSSPTSTCTPTRGIPTANWSYHGLQNCSKSTFSLCHRGGDKFRRAHETQVFGEVLLRHHRTPSWQTWPAIGFMDSLFPIGKLLENMVQRFNVPTEGTTFEPYEESSTPLAPDHTPGPVQETTPDDNQSPQVPNQILQVAWFLTALLNENPDTNAGLIQQIQQMPIGQPRDLHNDRVDPESLANLCAHLGILANMLSQQQPPAKKFQNSLIRRWHLDFLTSFNVLQHLAFWFLVKPQASATSLRLPQKPRCCGACV